MIKEEPGQVGFGRALKDFFKGYVEFLGRSTRAGYWWVQLVLGVIYGVLFGWLIARLVAGFMADPGFRWQSLIWPLGLLIVLTLATLLPSLALKVRRFRDVGIRGRGVAVLLILQYALACGNAADSYSTTFRHLALLSRQTNVSVATHSSVGVIIQTLSVALSLFMFVVTVLPTDTMLTTSHNSFWRFFLREQPAPQTTE